MTDLVRFGVAMEASLLNNLDALAERRGVNRSEVIRDLVRAEVARALVQANTPAVASLHIVYDHHIPDLTEKLTEVQHSLGDRVQCSLHIHLDAHHCMEVIILRGPSHELSSLSEKLLATRGVIQGGLQLVPVGLYAKPKARHKHPH